ncbi:MAG: hypothetical protein O3C21_10045, partial [Verrucomicrobia bacterium]|nr:hypothetical protein [Verrucomicrobiota bacterium]
VRNALREKLQILKEEVATALWSDSTVQGRLEILQHRLNDYQTVIRAAAISGGNADGVPATVHAELGLQAVNLGGLVESGQLEDAVIRRVVPATDLVLDAARRAAQVANAPQTKCAQAAAVAESINSLARWTIH